MRKTRLIRRLSVVIATAALAVVAAMQPASAAQRWIRYDHTEAQVDTQPANGAPSWVWGYVDPYYDTLVRGSVDYMYADGTVNSMWVNKGQSYAINVDQRVVGIRACEQWRTFDGTDSSFWWKCGYWSWV